MLKIARDYIYDNGKMDDFILAENEDPETMSFYDNKTIPQYWDLAKTIGIS